MKIKRFNELFENISENEVVSFLKKQMEKDKKEYTGDIPTKYNPGSTWDDRNWIVDEILQFLQNDYTTSYILQKFSEKYTYDELDNILKNNFDSEYRYSKKLIDG